MTDDRDGALAQYLDRLALRSPLTDEERAALLALAPVSTLADVQGDFVRLGERVTHACLIVDGLAARFAQIRNGARSTVALHIPGDMADLHSVVAPHVTWALRAIGPTRILRVPHKPLRALVDGMPGIAFAFWRDCVVDANVLAQWTVNVSRKDALARIAHLFAELAVRHAAVGLERDNSFPFQITQGDLADAVGLTPVHLNRVLKVLRGNGIATKEPGRVVIHDEARLRQIGEFEADYLQLERDDRDCEIALIPVGSRN